jgi:hypothetical protein
VLHGEEWRAAFDAHGVARWRTSIRNSEVFGLTCQIWAFEVRQLAHNRDDAAESACGKALFERSTATDMKAQRRPKRGRRQVRQYFIECERRAHAAPFDATLATCTPSLRSEPILATGLFVADQVSASKKVRTFALFARTFWRSSEQGICAHARYGEGTRHGGARRQGHGSQSRRKNPA